MAEPLDTHLRVLYLVLQERSVSARRTDWASRNRLSAVPSSACAKSPATSCWCARVAA